MFLVRTNASYTHESPEYVRVFSNGPEGVMIDRWADVREDAYKFATRTAAEEFIKEHASGGNELTSYAIEPLECGPTQQLIDFQEV